MPMKTIIKLASILPQCPPNAATFESPAGSIKFERIQRPVDDKWQEDDDIYLNNIEHHCHCCNKFDPCACHDSSKGSQC